MNTVQLSLRNSIAKILGFIYKWDDQRYEECWFSLDGKILDKHPIPNFIDFISQVWPNEEWYWDKITTVDGRRNPVRLTTWQATRLHDWPSSVAVKDTGDELADRLTLLLKILEWLQGNDISAFEQLKSKILQALESLE